MDFRIEYVPSAKSTSDRARRVWLRQNGPGYLYFAGIPFVAFVLCLSSNEILSSRVGLFVVGALLGIVATLGLLFFYSLLSFDKSALRVLRKRGHDPIHLQFNEEGVQAHFNGMTGIYGWNNFSQLRQQPSHWLLFHSETGYLSVPLEFADEELRAFILRKVGEANVKIAH